MGNVIKNADSLRDLSAYTVISEESLSDISGCGIVLSHKKSGARVAVISVPDNNKVFSIGFRTTPSDSTGVPHILEHSVLCGSEKFPVKEPFVELCKGSLNTFLNAMTYPDKTLYPVASCNDKDFANLMEVYLDAVLFPDIYKHKEIFLQEGWHYELESADAPLTYNGVVYSEMKGAFSSPEEVMNVEAARALYPDTTYGVVSGGDPNVIPSLTYEQFLEFHSKYYHPVNSYIYLYGDMDVRERLEWMDKEYLSKFEKIELDSSIAVQKDFDAVKTVEATYSVNTPEEEKDAAVYTWQMFLDADMDRTKAAAWDILLDVILNMPGSPLKVALTKAGIGAENYGWFSDGMKQPRLAIVTLNAANDKAEEFVTVVKETLANCVKEGVNKKSLLAALNRMEFRWREADTGRTPKGLLYLTMMFSDWLYNDDRVFDTFRWTKIFGELRALIDTDYFEKLIKEGILENKNAVIVRLYPKAGLLAEKEKELAKKLAAYKAGLSAKEVEKLVADTKALKEYQLRPDTPEALATIPKLARTDVAREAKKLVNETKKEQGITVYHQNLATNKIAYVKLMFDMKRLSKEQLPYAGILSYAIGDLNTKKHSYLELNNEIHIHTGGINTPLKATSMVDDFNVYRAFLSFEGKALYTKVSELVSYMKEMLFETVFDDTKRLEEILKEMKSRKEGEYSDMAYGAANARLGSYFSKGGVLHELTDGISFYEFIAGLLEDYEAKKEEIVANLKQTLEILTAKDLCSLSVTADEEGYAAVLREIGSILEDLKETSAGEGAALVPEKKNEGFKSPGQMQYVCCGGDFKSAGYSYHGAFEVLRTAMSYGYLWNNIRVTGGAYGGAFYAAQTGALGFISWRDPHLSRTMKVYAEAADYVEGFTADEEEITKYVIGTMSTIDAPMTPRMEGERGLTAALSGNSDERIQKIRNEILDVTAEDIRALAPAIRAALAQNYCCTIGSAKKVEEDGEHFMVIRDIMKK